MIYTFKSRATPDLMMMGPHGDHLLQLIGKTPAPQGIVDVEHLPAAIEALKSAVAVDENRHAHGDTSEDDADADGETASEHVGLRQRVWPMVVMMTNALAEKKDVVWGV